MIRVFRVYIPKTVVALVAFDFLLLAACFVFTIFAIKREQADVYLVYEYGGLSTLAVVGTVMAGLYFHDLYSRIREHSWLLLFQQILMITGIALVLQPLIAYLNPHFVLAQPAMLAGCALTLALVPLWRRAYGSFIYKGLGIERVLFIGTDEIGIEIANRLETRPELGLVNLGFIDDTAAAGTMVGTAPVLGRMADLQTVVRERHPDRIVVTLPDQRHALPVHVLLNLRLSGIRIDEGARMYEVAFGRLAVRRLRPSQLIFSTELGPKPRKIRMQSIYSQLIALVGLLFAIPLMAVIAVAIKLTSPGPILFRQTRVGLNGAPFSLYKFRSMIADAEARTGAVWASRSDPRVTNIGRILRTTRFDELPQLFNVLRGDMCLVGPRPERPEFVAALGEQIPFYHQRHCVKPGITGWAQINYKYGENVEDTIVKLEYDLYYIKNLSASLDAYIMFHTLKVMLLAQSGQ